MKTGDPSDGTVGSNPTLSAISPLLYIGMRKYPRGRRGSPAKGVGRETGARVQIPPSAPSYSVLYTKTLYFFAEVTPMLTLTRMEFQSDFSDFAKLVFNEFVMNMNMGRVFTQEEAADYFTYIMDYTKAHSSSGCYKVFLAQDFIGICFLWVRNNEAEVEYMLLPEYWNHGYATEIVWHLLVLARQHPQVQKVSGLTDPDNLPSQKVLTKNGFTFERNMHVEEEGSTVSIYSIMIKPIQEV